MKKILLVVVISILFIGCTHNAQSAIDAYLMERANNHSDSNTTEGK